MDRLTKYEPTSKSIFPYRPKDKKISTKLYIVHNLGQLEDIEEELGIDLIRSVNICKKANSQKYVYVKESYGIDKLTFLDNLDVELFRHRLYVNYRGILVSLDLKKYGKEWSLTRKELENDQINSNKGEKDGN